MKRLNQNGPREAVSFRADSASSQFLLCPAPKNIHEESSWKFKNSILYRTEHPEKGVSHVLVQQNWSTSIRITTLHSTSYLSQSYIDKIHVSEFAGIQHPIIWSRDNPGEIQQY